MLLDRRDLLSGSLRLVVLQTPLDEPKTSEVETLHEQFSGHGAAVEAIDPGLQKREDAYREDVIKTLRTADLVLVTGGDPERAVRVLRNTPALDVLHEANRNGAVVGGGSAGAMIFGAGMPQRSGRIAFLNWLPEFVIAPHYGNYSIERWRAAFLGETILGLPDRSVALVEGGRVVSMGEAPLVLLTAGSHDEVRLDPGAALVYPPASTVAEARAS